jgi:hypothetical protein
MQEIITQIDRQIELYYKLIQQDVVSPNALVTVQEKLACLSYTLAKRVGDCRAAYNDLKFTYNSKLTADEYKYAQEGLKTLTAKTASKFDNTDTLKAMLESENVYKRIKLILDQVNRILSTLMQRVSMLRKEQAHNNYIETKSNKL